MSRRKTSTLILLGVCASLMLSGCFQGYGRDVNSEEEMNILLLSLTPDNNPQTIPPTSIPQATRVPTVVPATPTESPVIMQGGLIIHIVADGETLFEIAQQYNVPLELLSTLNSITDPNSVFVDQALIIPPTNVPATPTEQSTETSNLPTESPTPLPTLTDTPTATVTASPTATWTVTPSATDNPPTFTFTPTTGSIITASSTSIPPSPVELSTLTPVPDADAQLSTDTQTIHVVETGENLFQISRRYNIPLETLAEINQIEDMTQVTIGQELLIPASGDVNVALVVEETIVDIPTETVEPTPPAPVTDTVIDAESPQSIDAVEHVVSSGDTLYQISLTYGVSLEALARENNITDASRLFAGQVLQIPDATPMAVLNIVTTASDATQATAPQRIAMDYPTQINGILFTQFVQISPEAEANIQTIFARGQELGRNPRAFSRLGDSTIENPHFLARFDNWEGFDYNLGEYAYLEQVINYYQGSFIRQGAAVRRGMHTWTVFDPQWADKTMCQSGESSLACEFRLHNPSVLFIRLGSNDVGVPRAFENNLRDIIEFTIENGVIPLLGTKADRNDGASNPNNQIIRRLSAEYNLPLWDFDRLADTLPRRGLTTDGVHMSINFSHDYTDPSTFRTGHGVHNLSALIMLDHLWQILSNYNTG